VLKKNKPDLERYSVEEDYVFLLVPACGSAGIVVVRGMAVYASQSP
jgi:hypothetical protein